MTIAASIVIAVEDELSGAVMEKLISVVGYNNTVRVINARGYGKLKTGMSKFREASRFFPHIVLTDLDRSPCPLALLANWGATQLPANLLIRVAVREVEAWLLADRRGISNFLNIDVSKVPSNPELEEDPKRTLINLARKSRLRRLSKEIVPSKNSSATIGPLYNYHFINYVNNHWDIIKACQNSQSLNRAFLRISSLMIK